MGIRDWFRASAVGQQVQQLAEQLSVERNNNELLQESVSDLERNLFDPGWIRFTHLAEQEFSIDGMRQLREICRLFTIQNPLLKRGAAVRAAYVWGQGVEVTARANGRQRGEQDVHEVVQRFLDDPSNVRSLTGAQARVELEHGLFTDGELFFAMFTSPLTGRVQVRPIPADQIVDIICNPDDAAEPWFYRRRWDQLSYAADGTPLYEQREQLYPCVDYQPRTRPRQWIGLPVDWSAPVLHTAVNRPLHWRRGIPDAYAAIDWARAYKIFLEDWATLVKALSRYAYRLSAKGSARKQVRERLAAAPPRDPTTGHAQDVGATAVIPMDQVLEAVPKTGATIDSDSGRPLAAMVAAALGVPVTMLLGDPGTTGARATAETLNKPTELEMTGRRDLWTGVLQRILAYVIAASVRAPKGPLSGVVRRDPYTDAEVVELAGNTTTIVDVEWPDLRDADVRDTVEAIVKAASTGTIPPEQIARMLLTALGVRQVDELVEAMTDPEDGAFQWPRASPLGGDGQAAVGTARSGGDPAAIGPGPMGDDDPEEPDEPEGDEDDELPEDEEEAAAAVTG